MSTVQPASAMAICHGTPFDFIRAACGWDEAHGTHDYPAAEGICYGSASPVVVADCGRGGPHPPHPKTDEAVITT